jgi:hypothetical protein
MGLVEFFKHFFESLYEAIDELLGVQESEEQVEGKYDLYSDDNFTKK